jgi:hypothetical protein
MDIDGDGIAWSQCAPERSVELNETRRWQLGFSVFRRVFLF